MDSCCFMWIQCGFSVDSCGFHRGFSVDFCHFLPLQVEVVRGNLQELSQLSARLWEQAAEEHAAALSSAQAASEAAASQAAIPAPAAAAPLPSPQAPAPLAMPAAPAPKAPSPEAHEYEQAEDYYEEDQEAGEAEDEEPPPPVSNVYRVIVRTGNRTNAGTGADISIVLFGSEAQTEELLLQDDNVFGRNQARPSAGFEPL